MKIPVNSDGFPCGFLDLDVTKEASSRPHFERYFFVLNWCENTLFYYEDDPKYITPPVEIGRFRLQYMSMVEDAANFKNRHPFSLAITISGMRYFIKAKTEQEKKLWIETIGSTARMQGQSLAPESRLHTTPQSSLDMNRFSIRSDVAPAAEYDSECSDDDRLRPPTGWTPVSAGEEPIKQGYCVKQGAIVKTWKKRWCILAHSGLAYYKNFENTRTPIRVITREEITDVRPSVGIHLNREHLFEVVTPHRVFYIQSEGPHDCEDWIESIKKIITPAHVRKFSTRCSTQTDNTGSLSCAPDAGRPGMWPPAASSCPRHTTTSTPCSGATPSTAHTGTTSIIAPSTVQPETTSQLNRPRSPESSATCRETLC